MKYSRKIKEPCDQGYSDFNKNLGKLLKQARKAENLSQEDVGTILGVSQDTISNHEKGASVSAQRLLEFAKVYKKPINFFYMGSITKK